jgi:small-conductance mechanosensitive channel
MNAMSTLYTVLLSLILVAGLPAGSAFAQEPEPPAAEAEITTAPIELDGAVLFTVRGASSLPAETRARRIEDRIKAVAADHTIPADSLRIEEREGVMQILAGDHPLAAVVEADARLEQVTLRELAAGHLRRIRQGIEEYRDARSPASLKRNAINALVGTALFIAALGGALWVVGRVDRLLMRRVRPHIHTIGIQSFTLMRAEWIESVVRTILGTVRTIVLVVLGLLFLGFVLGQFPLTRGLSQNMVAFMLRPVQVIGSGVVSSIPSLIFLGVLFFVVRLLLRLIRLFFDAVRQKAVTLSRFDPEWAEPTYKIIRLAVVAFALIVAYPYIPGSETDAFKGVSLFLGVVLSLGSSTAIANIIAGYMITYRRAFKIGDRIKVGNVMGDVIDTRLQVTHVRSFKNEEFIIPNSQILTTDVLNYSSISRESGLILHTDVGIGYETPWRQVEGMLLLAARRTTGLLPGSQPFVRLKALGDFAVTYELNAYCGNVQSMYQLYSELHKHILDVFNEYGVQIMTPAYESDPPAPKVVPRQDWFAEPALKRETAEIGPSVRS